MMAKVQTLKVSFAIGRHIRRDSFACRDEGQRAKPLGSRMVMSAYLNSAQARLASLWQLQSATGDELLALKEILDNIEL